MMTQEEMHGVAKIEEKLIQLDQLSVCVVAIKFSGGSLFLWIGDKNLPEISNLSLCIGKNGVSLANDEQSFSKNLSIHLSQLNGGKPVYTSVTEKMVVQLADRKSEFLSNLMGFLKICDN